VVSAIDITHDPKGGCDSYKLAETLRLKKDRRIKYVISNGKIFSSITSPWQWRPYSGSNRHDKHVHCSVQSSKALYDDTDDWNLGDMFDGTAPGPGPPDKPVLRRGDKGPAVVELQKKLDVEADGYFGPNTEAAVTHFQERRKLVADGVVGAYTWAELERPDPGPINNPKQDNIVCTKFGGGGDPNKSAYAPYDVITDTELSCALPFRFPGTRPQVKVTNRANNKSVICNIRDIGPWNIDDPYWTTGQRPQAETGRDEKGRKTNLAGIDITPGADAAIDCGGMCKVDWEFVVTDGGGGDEGHEAIAKLAEEIARLSNVIAEASAQLATATAALASALASFTTSSRPMP
jgi:peptidoglycan hydrolase-like protein with peptidoglycan-binding domain